MWALDPADMMPFSCFKTKHVQLFQEAVKCLTLGGRTFYVCERLLEFGMYLHEL